MSGAGQGKTQFSLGTRRTPLTARHARRLETSRRNSGPRAKHGACARQDNKGTIRMGGSPHLANDVEHRDEEDEAQAHADHHNLRPFPAARGVGTTERQRLCRGPARLSRARQHRIAVKGQGAGDGRSCPSPESRGTVMLSARGAGPRPPSPLWHVHGALPNRATHRGDLEARGVVGVEVDDVLLQLAAAGAPWRTRGWQRVAGGAAVSKAVRAT